jgi:hypothetical protein
LSLFASRFKPCIRHVQVGDPVRDSSSWLFDSVSVFDVVSLPILTSMLMLCVHACLSSCNSNHFFALGFSFPQGTSAGDLINLMLHDYLPSLITSCESFDASVVDGKATTQLMTDIQTKLATIRSVRALTCVRVRLHGCGCGHARACACVYVRVRVRGRRG